MMWGYEGGMGWGWAFGLLALVGIVLLIVLTVRLFAGGTDRGGNDRRDAPPTEPPATYPAPAPGRSRARLILDERFAKGELTAEQYREQLQVLGEDA